MFVAELLFLFLIDVVYSFVMVGVILLVALLFLAVVSDSFVYRLLTSQSSTLFFV